MKNNAERCWVAYSTVDSHVHATALAHRLVDEQLVACVNIVGPVESVYRWQGKVEQAKEWMLMMKCSESQCAELKRALTNLHGYEVPELILLPITDGHMPYLNWIAESGKEFGHD